MILACDGAALAADVMELPTTRNSISFPHKNHQLTLKDCTKCHEKAEGGKIADLGKEWAHKHCRDCHNELMKGPQACRDCHKRIAVKPSK